MKKLLSVFALTSMMVGGSVGSALADDHTSVTVESVNTSWNKAFNSGDKNALAALYAENATLSPGNGQILVGREAITELFGSFIDNGVKNHTIETVETYQHGDQIVQLGKWHAEGVNNEQQTISFGGVLMTVIEKNLAGEWQTKSHIWNMAN